MIPCLRLLSALCLAALLGACASSPSSRLGDLPLPLPDLSEQTRMVEQSESRRAKYERLRASLERQVALLREHRHALITCSVAPPREDEAA